MNPNMIIRIDLERVKNSVASMLAEHNTEIQELVEFTLAETLTEDWVKERIKTATRKVIEEAINSVGNSLMAKQEIRNVVITHVVETLSKKHNSG